MNKRDFLQRFLFENAPVRGEIVHLGESYQTIIDQHEYPPFIKKLLGEVLIATILLSATIKFNGRLTVQFKGKGKLKLLVAQCNEQFQIRGLAQFDPDLREEEVLAALKNGVLGIMIDPEVAGGRQYQGIVEWQGNSVAESLEGYFLQSEQLPTRLWISLNETSASGFLLQVMPSEKPELYQNDWEHLVHLTNTLTDNELLNLDNSALLKRLYVEEDVRLFEQIPVGFRCTCSYQRSEHAIELLGKKEAEDELKTKENIIVSCEFCNTEYVFDKIEKVIKHQGRHKSTK